MSSLIPQSVPAGRYQVLGAAAAGRYDDDGRLLETALPDANGKFDLTTGTWWFALRIDP